MVVVALTCAPYYLLAQTLIASHRNWGKDEKKLFFFLHNFQISTWIRKNLSISVEDTLNWFLLDFEINWKLISSFKYSRIRIELILFRIIEEKERKRFEFTESREIEFNWNNWFQLLQTKKKKKMIVFPPRKFDYILN